MIDRRPPLSRAIEEVLRLDPSAPAVEYDRRWYRWGDLGTTAESILEQVGPATRVGVLLRNRPAHVGLLIGLLRAGACVATINPGRGDDRVREELAALSLPAVAGHSEDLYRFVVSNSGAVRLSCDDLGSPVGASGPLKGSADASTAVAVEMLTSGTTGPPKRVPLTYDTLQRVLVGAKYYEGQAMTQPRLRSGVAIVNAPLVHLGGLFRVLQCVSDGRSFCLLERFRVDEWLDAVRRHRPATVSLVPAALRMVLEADLDPADLSSIRSVVSGTAPLSADDADAFTAKYGIPVLVSYAATEFGGGVAGWNLADHRAFWSAKRGSVGRPHPGCALRVVDPDTGSELAAGQAGLLEVKARQLGDGSGWTRTTDLARIDPDGFVWILGRADQAIIRGGFKILPDEVRAVLERDPRVRAAAVVGRPDTRLGEVPVAAVELRDGAVRVEPADILATAAEALSPYEIPVELRVVEQLPRTPSGKVDLVAARRQLASDATATVTEHG